jgi:hypothetical protein
MELTPNCNHSFLDGISFPRLVCFISLCLVLYGCVQGSVSSKAAEDAANQVKSIAIAPLQATVANGEIAKFSASAELLDGTLVDITSDALWSVTDATSLVSDDIAVPVAPGEISTQGIGNREITISYLGKSASAGLVIGTAKLASIAIKPKGETARIYLVQDFIATGIFSDGSSQDLTAVAKWSSSNEQIATVLNDAASSGQVQLKKAGQVTISAQFGEIVGSVEVNVPDISMTELRIEPDAPYACAGSSTPLTVMGRYADGVEVDITSAISWQVQDPEVVTISSEPGSKGVAQTKYTGATVVKALLPTELGNLSDQVNFLSVAGLSLVKPIGAEIFYVGAPNEIAWASCGESAPTGKIRIEYSNNSGGSFTEIHQIDEAANTWSWTPLEASETSKFRIVRVEDAAVSATSQGDFFIRPPFLTLDSHNNSPTWPWGSDQAISWLTGGVNGDVIVELSRDNGSSWSEIGRTSSTTLNYTEVAAPATSQGKLRIRSASNPALSDISDGNITITVPTLSVTSPNGGEVLDIGVASTISWTAPGMPANTNLKIELSRDGGTSWQTLDPAAPNAGSFAYTPLSNHSSTQARIRISAATEPTITDTSNANFAIVAQLITVTSPNGGEVLYTGAASNITWTADASASGDVTVAFSTDGTNWTELADDIDAQTEIMSWTHLVGQISTTARIRVSLNSFPTIKDISNNTFTVRAPGIELTSPNGGENWEYGSTRAITWVKHGITDTVKIQYSSNSGSSWTDLTTNQSGTSYNWSISQALISTAMIRVVDETTGTYSDQSNAPFSIVAPNLAITAPNGGEVWYVGQTNKEITWNTASLAGPIELHYTKNGTDFIQIDNNDDIDDNDGSFIWSSVPNDPSVTVKVRVRLKNQNSVADLSNNDFSIVAPFVSLTSPNGGESWNFASTQAITWTSGGVSGNLNVELSRDGGSNWTTIASGVNVTAGTTNHTVTELATTTALVRITMASGGQTDTSNNHFSITNVPSITVTAPNGGEVWYTGASSNITWTTSGALTGNVTIKRSIDNGSSYSNIATGISASAGTYSWTPSAGDVSGSADALIQIVSETYAQINDVSNAPFEVKAPFITVSSPASGVTWNSDESRSITWTSGGFTGNVVLAYSTNGGSSYTTIATVSNSGTYSWTVPAAPSSNSKVKVSSFSDSNIYGVSATFTLADGSAYIVRGSASNTTKSTIDGVDQTTMCGDGICSGSGDALSIDDDLTIGSLTLRNSAYVIIPEDCTSTIREIVVESGSTLVIASQMSFTSVTNSGTITGSEYLGTYSSGSWSPAQGVGAGKLIFEVTGTLTNNGVIHMDAKNGASTGPAVGGGVVGCGYDGDYSTAQGGSHAHGGSDPRNLCGRAAGTAISAVDWQTLLHLGGRGGGTSTTSNYGGGAISITAGSLVVASGARISADGGNGNSNAIYNSEGLVTGGGAGGSILLAATSSLDIQGTVRALGGTGGNDSVGNSAGSGSIGRIAIQSSGSASMTGSAQPFAELNFARSYSLVVRGGSTTKSTVDGVSDPTLCWDGYCTGTSDAFEVPNGMTISRLELASNAYVIIPQSSTAVVGEIVVGSGSTLEVNSNLSFTSVTNSGTITAGRHYGTYSGGVWSPTVGPGAGHLKFSVSGALVNNGTISMAGKNLTSGPGTGGGGASCDGGDGESFAGGGGNATAGTNGTFAQCGAQAGAAIDGTNWTTLLTMGGRGGGSTTAGGGGGGGGGIHITAANITNQSGATITAAGATRIVGSGRNGGGAGGAVVLIASSELSNLGMILADGGSGGATYQDPGLLGGSGANGRIKLIYQSAGTMSGTTNPTPE